MGKALAGAGVPYSESSVVAAARCLAARPLRRRANAGAVENDLRYKVSVIPHRHVPGAGDRDPP